MIKLESAVARWRRTLVRLGVRSRDDLDELEDHLHSLVEENLADSQDLKQALDTAIGRFGRLEDLASDWVAAPLPPRPSSWKARDRLTLSVNLGLYGYDDAQGRIYFESLRERVLTAPGVHSAAWSWQRPPRTWRRDRRSTRRSWTSTSRAQSTRDHR